MLSKNIPQAEVARILNCTPSAVSQVAATYATKIAEASTLSTTSTEVMEDSMDRIENKLLEKIENTLPLETDLMKLTKMFQVVNGAKRRSKGEGHVGAGNVTVDNRKVVQLNLPAHMQRQVEYTTNNQNQVVEINGRNLSIASTKSIEKMAGIGDYEDEQQELQLHDDTALQGDGTGQGDRPLPSPTNDSREEVSTTEAASITLEDFDRD